jgi:hypothetical protein
MRKTVGSKQRVASSKASKQQASMQQIATRNQQAAINKHLAASSKQ